MASKLQGTNAAPRRRTYAPTVRAILVTGGLLLPAPAAAAVTTPHPGLQLVRQGARAMIIADLCAPGVSVRATKYAERKATPQTWGTARGLQAAMNADFFDFPAATYVLGRARGGGEDWPASQMMKENHHYFEFGPGFSNWINPGSTAPTATATDIVGTHNPIVMNGQPFDDGALGDLHPRSAIGLNLARTRLYLFSSKDSLTGAGISSNMLSMSAEANGGKPDIDVAMNVDGGGSSQLYVQGLGQIVTSGRLVANHLGVYAAGSGSAPQCPGSAPIGAFDAATCSDLSGWTQDVDDKTAAITAVAAFDTERGAAGTRETSAIANGTRPDLAAAIGSTNHGFGIQTPYGIFDGAEHAVFAYGVSRKGRTSKLGEKKLQCPFSMPSSRKRRVASPAIYTAWKFDGFVDTFPEPDDETSINALQDGTDITAAPVLVRADDGFDAVYWLDEGQLRLVRDPRAWHLDSAKAEVRTAASLAAMTKGLPLRQRPMLIRSKSTGSIYLLESLIDENPPDAGTGEAPSSSGSGDGGSDSPVEPSDGSSCQASRRSASSYGFLSLGIVLSIAALRRGRRKR